MIATQDRTAERKTLREWREERLMTQDELGVAAGLSGATISHWETGRNAPRFKTLKAIARALGVRPDQIARV